MAHAPPSANASAVDPEGLKDLSLVFALHPPAPASARDRAAAGYFPRIRSDELDVPLPPRGLHVVTARDLPQVGVDDDPGAQSTDESSELPSPDPSSPGLHTPMDSPPVTTHALSMSKEDVPDIGHLFIHNRAPASSVGGSGRSERTQGAICVKPPMATSVNNSIRHQAPWFYKLVIEFKCDVEHAYGDDPEGSAEPLGLFIDTGSDDTFGFGEGTLQIKAPRADMESEPRIPWSNDSLADQPHTFITDEYDPSLTDRELTDQGLVLGRMHYADNALAHLVLMEEKTMVLHCYDRKLEETRPVYLRWRFGATIGANEKLWRDDSDGMLGLGARGIQTAYRDSENLADDLPNFLAVLRGKLKEIPPSARRGEDIAMFFCLRFAPQWYQKGLPGHRPIQSWLSFNTWPCSCQPPWNRRKIIVVHSSPHRREWAVYLRSIKFARVESNRRPATLQNLESKYLEDATINFVKPGMDWGLKVLLDTGCCVTHLPPDAVQSMNKNLFGNKDALKEPQDGMPPPTYKIDPNCWLLKEPWKVQVVYEFGGEGTTSVFVTGPLEGFAYQRYPHSRTRSDNPDNLEGLVFSSRWAEIWNVGTLGQNFFQTMYVSLHKATDGLDFVRMAGQWPEQLERDLEDYYVAGVSSK